MAYRPNPFLERMAERTTSDNDFVQLFSPHVLDQLKSDVLEDAVHVFKSPPGGGKTTILRAFTPPVLRAFSNAKATQRSSFQLFESLGVVDATGPVLLGVFLSCAAGYSDLPPGVSETDSGLFRALFNCRVVLRALRSVAELAGYSDDRDYGDITLEYPKETDDLISIPRITSPAELARWAEEQELAIYRALDSLGQRHSTPTNPRFEGLLWLQHTRFMRGGADLAPKRLLMIDDIQRLRRAQRELIVDELIVLRPRIPVWLAGRSVAFSDSFLGQGARSGRDLRVYSLEETWSEARGPNRFENFAKDLLERRLHLQQVVASGPFETYLRDHFLDSELAQMSEQGWESFQTYVGRHRSNTRYGEWLSLAEGKRTSTSYQSLIDLYSIRILIARDAGKKQLSLELAPLSTDEMEERDSGKVAGAAAIFLHHELGVPYYFGFDQLCSLATNNVDELLYVAAAMFESISARAVLHRASSFQLSPAEQERSVKEAAERKRNFIPKSHSDGRRAQRLLDAIGLFCREKTFQLNAPYAPGVTGVRLSATEVQRLHEDQDRESGIWTALRRVLRECVAENLLTERESKPSTGREGGIVLNLNRLLCSHYDLPLNYGGWQDVSLNQLADWMEKGLRPSMRLRFEAA